MRLRQGVGDLCRQIEQRFNAIGPRRSSVVSGSPSTSSETMNGVSPATSASKTVRMLG